MICLIEPNMSSCEAWPPAGHQSADCWNGAKWSVASRESRLYLHNGAVVITV